MEIQSLECTNSKKELCREEEDIVAFKHFKNGLQIPNQVFTRVFHVIKTFLALFFKDALTL